MYMDNIAANESLRYRLCSDILSGHFSHAYIIEGRVGTGRHLVAYSIAAALMCENKHRDGAPLPCHTCSNCLKIEKGISPDVMTLRKDPDRATLGVEVSRFIRNDIYMYPNDSDYKIYIIEDADIMTPQAQNALLLTLEEPPPYAVIILICENADSLLDTVRSRAPILRTETVPFDVMSEYLCASAPEKYSSEARRIKNSSSDEFYEIIASSNGGIGKAYELLDKEARAPILERRKQIRELMDKVIEDGSRTAVFDAVFSLSSKRDELSDQLEIILAAVRDLIILKKSEEAPLCFYTDRDRAIELSSTKPAVFLFKFISACEEAIASVEKNANVKLTLSIFAANISTK